MFVNVCDYRYKQNLNVYIMLFLKVLTMIEKKKDYIISGISFPKSILSKIDKDRGPIPRSTFLVKLIELAYNTNRIKPQERFG